MYRHAHCMVMALAMARASVSALFSRNCSLGICVEQILDGELIVLLAHHIFTGNTQLTD